jgi:type IV pilus assembly protein PilW
MKKPKKRFSCNPPNAAQRGLSMVEIMVAMVIGLIGILVIMQVARTAEAQKRLTTGMGESQNNGTLAVYSVERDVKQAGYGFNSLSVIGCPLTIPEGRLNHFVPIVINPTDEIPAGDANTDTLLVTLGSSEGAPEGDTINSVWPLGGDKQELGVMSVNNFKMLDGRGEWALVAPVVPENGCALRLSRISVVNAVASTVTVEKLVAEEGQNLFSLGFNPRIMGYAIRGGNLTACDYMQSDCGEVDNWTVIANGIVSLRAQYGHRPNDKSSGIAWNRTAPVPLSPPDQEKFACAWAHVSAVRLALVARNGEPAGSECVNDANKCPTRAAPLWAGSPANPASPGAGEIGIDLSANTDWRHYRYQTYETVIPIRNIPWMGTCTLSTPAP